MSAPLQASSSLSKLVWRDILYLHTLEDQGYSSPGLCQHKELSWSLRAAPQPGTLQSPFMSGSQESSASGDAPYSFLFWGP